MKIPFFFIFTVVERTWQVLALSPSYKFKQSLWVQYAKRLWSCKASFSLSSLGEWQSVKKKYSLPFLKTQIYLERSCLIIAVVFPPSVFDTLCHLRRTNGTLKKTVKKKKKGTRGKRQPLLTSRTWNGTEWICRAHLSLLYFLLPIPYASPYIQRLTL